MTSGTEQNIHFIYVSQIPQGKKATYLKVVIANKPSKAIRQHVSFTVGSEKSEYAGDCSTKTADLMTANFLFNSVLSTPGTKFMTMDIKDFYLLDTPMVEYKYMRIPLRYIPAPIMAATVPSRRQNLQGPRLCENSQGYVRTPTHRKDCQRPSRQTPCGA